ncbi:hypothetical protein MK137Hg11_000287100, partial [Dysgonomonas reticulitermitis]
MSDEFQENLLSALVFEGMVFRAGAATLQYRFLADDWDTSIEPDLIFNKTEKRFYCPASRIKHETLEIDGQKPYWTAPEYNTDVLDASTPYYLYLKCSKNLAVVDGRLTGEAVFFISAEKIKIEDQDGFYTLWVAFINSENEEGDRSFTTMYGLAELLPGQLTVDTWRTADGKSFIKGLKSQIKIGDLDYNYTKQNALTLMNADITIKDKTTGDIIAHIDGETGAALFGRGTHLFNADGSLNFADGSFLYDLINGLSVTGKIQSNANGVKISIDPSDRALVLTDANNDEIARLSIESSNEFGSRSRLYLKKTLLQRYCKRRVTGVFLYLQIQKSRYMSTSPITQIKDKYKIK